MGLEHEYRLGRDGERLDFRELIHGLAVPGRRLDPGDINAYRCASGLVLTSDDEEAEVASPPVRLRPGFTRRLERWAAAGRAELVALLPVGIVVSGYSTHLSAALPDSLAARVATLHARSFTPTLMLVMDRLSSHGVFVRPRPGRLELCGEYASGARLRAASAFYAGSVRACAAAAIGGPLAAPLPPELAVNLEAAVGRYGLYVGRHAFGFDLYEAGRQALLPMVAGGTIGGQEHLELAWIAARSALGADADEADLAAADSMIAGSCPLGVETDREDLTAIPTATTPSPFGQVIEVRRRAEFEVAPEVATWSFTVFRLQNRRRRAYACVPSSHLSRFLRDIDAGRLDAVLAASLDAAPTGRVLATNAQTQEPDVWDEVGPAAGLLSPERDATGRVVMAEDAPAASSRLGKAGRLGKPSLISVRPARVGPTGPTPVPAGRPAPTGSTIPPGVPSTGRPGHPVLVALVVVAMAMATAAIALFGSSSRPGTGPSSTVSPTGPVSGIPTSSGPTSSSRVPSKSPDTLPSTAPFTTRTTSPPTSEPPLSSTSAVTSTVTAPPTISTTAVIDPGRIDILAGCSFTPPSSTRPTDSTVTFRNQTAGTVSVFINAPAGGADVTLVVNPNQESSPYTLAVGGTYFVECSGTDGGGGMQITATA